MTFALQPVRTMKSIILILVVAFLAYAAPKPTNLKFRNLYKKPVAESKIRPHIIGGQEAEPHSVPYQVYIEAYNDAHFWYCGGSLISHNYILASAFCLEYPLESNVILGAHNPLLNEDTQIRMNFTWHNVTYHEDFDRNLVINDIAVMNIHPVEFTDAIQPVALPKRADVDDSYVGSIARVSGWGPTDGFGADNPQGLRLLDVEIISKSECEEYYRELPDSNLCTSGKEAAGICDGDVGGPLVLDGVQIGIASFNIFHCLNGYPSGYTKLTSFLDWIEENTDVIIE